jgi:hypothetical protein
MPGQGVLFREEGRYENLGATFEGGAIETHGRMAMARCFVCGNDYDKAFTITAAGKSHTFDSFECAIHALAPTCAHCKCKIVGHGA